jgi:hypothetical protein
MGGARGAMGLLCIQVGGWRRAPSKPVLPDKFGQRENSLEGIRTKTYALDMFVPTELVHPRISQKQAYKVHRWFSHVLRAPETPRSLPAPFDSPVP